MSPTPPIVATPYRLGFEVRHAVGPVWSAGHDVIVTLELDQANSEAVDSYRGLVTMFFMLAGTGALSGASIPPWKSLIDDRGDPSVSGRHIEWGLVGCLIDERATAMLAQILLIGHVKYPIKRLLITPKGDGGRTSELLLDPSRDPYPEKWPSLRFPNRYDANSYDVPCLYVTWSRVPTADEREQIEAPLHTWAVATSHGCYGVAQVPPEECGMVVSPTDLEWIDDVLEWPFSDFRAHPSAINGLLNVCGALDQKTLPISNAVIE